MLLIGRMCDSSTVLAWIQRQEEWSIFVRNRDIEVRELGSCIVLCHISGQLNPADLPCNGGKTLRGCTVMKTPGLSLTVPTLKSKSRQK